MHIFKIKFRGKAMETGGRKRKSKQEKKIRRWREKGAEREGERH
jgi:hypothetical protein